VGFCFTCGSPILNRILNSLIHYGLLIQPDDINFRSTVTFTIIVDISTNMIYIYIIDGISDEDALVILLYYIVPSEIKQL
jgi:hypothetical protein